MKTFLRDDTEHGVEYVTKAEYQQLLEKHNEQLVAASKAHNALRNLILTHLVDDDAWDREKQADRLMEAHLGACPQTIEELIAADLRGPMEEAIFPTGQMLTGNGREA